MIIVKSTVLLSIWMYCGCLAETESDEGLSSNATVAATSGTTSTVSPKPTTPEIKCDEDALKDLKCGQLENKQSIECSRPGLNISGLNFSCQPNLKVERNDTKSVVFGDASYDKRYNVTVCITKPPCKKCQSRYVVTAPYIDEGILQSATSGENSLSINYTEWESEHNGTEYHFEISKANSVETLWARNGTRTKEVTFENLSSGTAYRVKSYATSRSGIQSINVSRVFVTKPRDLVLKCAQEEVHSLKVKVENEVLENDDLDAKYDVLTKDHECGGNGAVFNFCNLVGETNYSFSFQLKLKVKNSSYSVLSNDRDVNCTTTIREPEILNCQDKVTVQHITATRVNLSIPYPFTNNNGKVKTLLLILTGPQNENNSLGIPASDCFNISHVYGDLPSGDYHLKLKAYNSNNESSEAVLDGFKIEGPDNTLTVILAVIIFLLVSIILILVCLLCRCEFPFSRRRRATISESSTSFSRFIARRARRMKRLPPRMSHHAVVRTPIRVSDFPQHVEELEKDSGLRYSEEFEDLKNIGKNLSTEDALLQCNRPKNRFVNILPYDVTRVKLQPIEDEEGSDYINANWIPGFHSKREFIAAQGPLTSTIDHFWRMVWEHNCPAVIMLTLLVEKNKLKCDQYWPPELPTVYGELQVSLEEATASEQWCLNKFKLEKPNDKETRIVNHFHYLEWPDMNVPDSESLMSFIRFIRENSSCSSTEETIRPIVIHCSAGVGRTGTFIALDTLMKQLENMEDLDVYGTVSAMRLNRVLMVQTEQQYVFLYRCMKELVEKSGLPGHHPSPEVLQIHREDEQTIQSAGSGDPMVQNGLHKPVQMEKEVELTCAPASDVQSKEEDAADHTRK